MLDLRFSSQSHSVIAYWPVPIPNYAAWWQGHKDVNKLLKVVSQPHHDRKSNHRVSSSDFLSPVHTSNNVEATFDFVAKNCNNIERVHRKASSFWQSRMLLRHCCRFWQQCRTSFSWKFVLSTKSKQNLFPLCTCIAHAQFNLACAICCDIVKRTKFRSTFLPQTATMSKQSSTLSKKSFDL